MRVTQAAGSAARGSADCSRRVRSLRYSATSQAFCSSARTCAGSLASGTPDRPSTSTGVDGPAAFTGCPCSSNMARTRPYSWPHSSRSRGRRQPACTSTVAVGPRPRSRLDSITTPFAMPEAGARRSSSSACSEIASSSAATPSPVLADTGTNRVSPPQSSGRRSSAARPVRTFSGSAFSRSILLMATITGTPAARAWRTASSVCGMTPSSAATTSTTRSVQCAPRPRMEVNAACPGVSRKVIRPCSVPTR